MFEPQIFFLCSEVPVAQRFPLKEALEGGSLNVGARSFAAAGSVKKVLHSTGTTDVVVL